MSEKPANNFDLGDSSITDIQRGSDRLLVKLDQRRNGYSKHITIRVSGNFKESTAYYIGHNVTAPHPDTNLPLDYIEQSEQGADYLELGGYLNSEPWYVWRITGGSIEIVST
jgi:hypothetical protein